MRRLWAAAVVLLLAGCGSAGATAGGGAHGRAATSSTAPLSSHPAAPATPSRGEGSEGSTAPTSEAPSPATSSPRPASRDRTKGVPGPADWEAISRAVYASPLTAQVPDTEYVVVGLQLAGTDGQWAGGMIEPRKPNALQPAAVLLHRVAGRWKLVDLGTAMVGCGVAPRAVLEQLRFFNAPPHC